MKFVFPLSLACVALSLPCNPALANENLIQNQASDEDSNVEKIDVTYRYVDGQIGDDDDLSYWLPSYQLAGLFAKITILPALALHVNVDNLFNETYVF